MEMARDYFQNIIAPQAAQIALYWLGKSISIGLDKSFSII
ncbi:hypothetical protein MICAE_2860001 [Microcystis aeruginosa PCC 9806]|uniref:Uncharacterized protein n=1 Tax=Microcystis aeruginosa PCC 9806 TaxID=1160282 RepID=I4GXE6_MICAE|nr:hypothetical protein MICAE_2860001 [Microcystis aeruginosa PCC 9806]